MDGLVLKIGLRLLGSLLLVSSGIGAGRLVYLRQQADWIQIDTLAQLLLYWDTLLKYQALTDRELIRRAVMYPEFAALGVQEGCILEELPLPHALPSPMGIEIRQGLKRMALEPRKAACSTLQRLAALCERTAEQKRQRAEAARTFWPRLGGCLGTLVAILLW